MILLIGAGALGTVVAQELSGMPLTVQDYDIVQEANLARTPFFTPEDVGRLKAAVVGERLGCAARNAAFGPDTPLDGVSLLIDCSDDQGVKLLANDRAREHGIPLVVGVAAESTGMAFRTGEACWQCVTHGKTPVDDCSAGIDPGIARSTGIAIARLARTPQQGLLVIDAQRERTVTVPRHPRCDACRGVYAYVRAPFSMRFCEGTRKLQARPSAPRRVELTRVPGEVLARYPGAVRVRLGPGSALVHEHGLIEYDSVPAPIARVFAQRLFPYA